MEIYQTEEQQVEAIKSFWAANGNSIIAGLVIGFAVFIGFNYYKSHRLVQQQKIADAYMTDVDIATKTPEKFDQVGAAFIDQYSHSSYAALTALMMAKNVSVHKDWSQVAKYLQTAIDKAPNPGLKAIATLRLVYVQTQLKQYSAALATLAILAKTMPKTFTASVKEAQGDIYVLQHKTDLARDAYQAAIDAGGLKLSPALQVKVDDLAMALN